MVSHDAAPVSCKGGAGGYSRGGFDAALSLPTRGAVSATPRGLPDEEPCMLVSTAFAQDAAGGGGALIQILPLILIFVVFYFLLIRPQQKKARQHREMVAALKRGDRVVTGGGLHATVSRVEDDATVILELAPNVRVKAQRNTIAELASRPEPRAAAGDDKRSGS